MFNLRDLYWKLWFWPVFAYIILARHSQGCIKLLPNKFAKHKYEKSVKKRSAETDPEPYIYIHIYDIRPGWTKRPPGKGTVFLAVDFIHFIVLSKGTQGFDLGGGYFVSCILIMWPSLATQGMLLATPVASTVTSLEGACCKWAKGCRPST